MKTKEICRVISQEEISDGIYSMWIRTEKIAGETVPGQFISLYCHDRSKLLPRPISICEIDQENNALRIVYRVTGENTGTKEFSEYKEGTEVTVLGPLGNGFPLAEAEGKKVMLIGGGIGVPPMLETAKQLKDKAEVQAVLGYRDRLFLDQDFSRNAALYIATEDGSSGSRGTVLDAISDRNLTADVIFACGPTPMLRAIKNYALEKGILCYVSMEEKMACGIGACLGCVCRSTEKDAHSQVNNKRICKDGPVFLSTEVEL